ncbi:glutamine--fructose-6-phosphate transaminase (isomerizing) [Candidatus Dependentiae bacterium]|nr:glutamine--fructose-6-phosphate transaminase (isomerizing) [Candidatus Dependentiae bacterium]
MCGIVGYVGQGKCKKYVIDGLKRLEYRGYDSAGFVCIDQKHKQFNFFKKVGHVQELEKALHDLELKSSIGIGHSRWATHGIVNELNTHPHFNCDKSIAVVHNGIVESYEEIRKKLIESRHEFESSTDTEVVAHLLESLIKTHKTLKAAIVDLVRQLKGAYALVFLFEQYPDQLLLIRKRSPLLIGVGDDEMFIASDVLAFCDQTNKVIFMPEESFAIVKKDQIELFDFEGKALIIKPQEIDFKHDQVDKQGFEHYMLKEIYEQKRSIDRSISFCKFIGSNNFNNLTHISDNFLTQEAKIQYQDSIWSQLGITSEKIKELKYIYLIAAGTSWHACRIAQFFFENICKIPTYVYLASEFGYMPFFPEENSLAIFVTQSGETADTLEALRVVNSCNVFTVAITNVPSSSIVREANGFLPMQAGPEISVASTKAFSTQVSVLFWLANRVALEKKLIDIEVMKAAEEDLLLAAEVLEISIESYKWEIKQTLAKKYSKYNRFIFLGRHISYPFALEAALKLKEISYIFAQCYPAGELKHGPIALIDKETPVILFSSLNDLIYQKLVANAQEVKARNGHLVTFVFEGQQELIELSDYSFIVSRVNPFLGPLAMTGLMQFFIYQITKELDRPIDRPRNLAKSVTVE